MKALAIAFELIAEHGEISTQEINRVLTLRNVKSSVQYVGIIMRDLVNDGTVERTRYDGNKAAYRFSTK